MSLLNVLKFAFHIMAERKKVLLPATVTWIPTISYMVVFAFILSDLSLIETYKTFQAAEGLIPLLSSLGPLTVLVFLLLGLVSWVSAAFLQIVYVDITRSASEGGEPSLADSFYEAKGNLLSLMWIHLLAAVSIGMVLVVAASAALAASSLLGSYPASLLLTVGVLISGYLGVKFWLAPVSLVVEERRGWEALTHSFSMSTGHFWRILLVLLVMGTTTASIGAGLSRVPAAGFSLNLLASLFFAVWLNTVPPAFYYEYSLDSGD